MSEPVDHHPDEVGSIPSNRCGYRYDVSTLPEVGAATCWRETWGDHDRCVWHARDATKVREDLEASAVDGPERLDGASLEEISLTGIDWFDECTLIGADISGVDLRNAALTDADFREAHFENVDARGADFTGSNLEDASVDFSDLRDARLERVRIDQTVFSNVRIDRETVFGERSIYDQQLAEAEGNDELQHLAQAAIWAYREITDLHERNALAFESREYHLLEKDVRRRLAWHTDHYGRAIKAEASRWVTGYGMSPWRVVGTALVVVVLSAFLYPTTGGLEETISRGGDETTITWSIEDLETTSWYVLVFVFFRSLYFSVITFTTLGYGDISPIGDFARALAGVEALLGQALMALLVFVLSRRIS